MALSVAQFARIKVANVRIQYSATSQAPIVQCLQNHGICVVDNVFSKREINQGLKYAKGLKPNVSDEYKWSEFLCREASTFLETKIPDSEDYTLYGLKHERLRILCSIASNYLESPTDLWYARWTRRLQPLNWHHNVMGNVSTGKPLRRRRIINMYIPLEKWTMKKNPYECRPLEIGQPDDDKYALRNISIDKENILLLNSGSVLLIDSMCLRRNIYPDVKYYGVWTLHFKVGDDVNVNFSS